MDKLATALRDVLISPNESDRNLEPANVVDGLFAIARAINNAADAIQKLGNGNASTHMGALEAFGLHMGEKVDGLAEAISSLSSSNQ